MTILSHRFTIRAPLNFYEASVEIDGKKLDGVTGISFAMTADKLTEVTLKIYGEVFVEGEFRPRELAHVKREMLHPASLRARISKHFAKIFLGASRPYIDGLTNGVMCDLEKEYSSPFNEGDAR